MCPLALHAYILCFLKKVLTKIYSEWGNTYFRTTNYVLFKGQMRGGGWKVFSPKYIWGCLFLCIFYKPLRFHLPEEKTLSDGTLIYIFF